MRSLTIAVSACAAFFVVAAVSVAGPPRLSPFEHGEATAVAFDFDLPKPLVPRSDYDNYTAGLPKGIKPEILTWDRIYSLALIRARTRRGAFSPTLDPAALTVEAARHGVHDFARFRANFDGNGPFHDPGPSALDLQGRLLAIDNARRNAEFHESLHKLIVERSMGLTSGVSRIDVDSIFAELLRANQKLADETKQFRDGLDELKFLLGLSPRAPVILDRRSLVVFAKVFDAVEEWQRTAERKAETLAALIDQLAVPGDIVLNGEPILERIEQNPDRWEEVLAGAGELAFKSRSQRDGVLAQPNSGIRLELRVRRRIRDLYDKKLAFRLEKRCYELAVRLKDQSLEPLLAPPSPTVTSRSTLVKGVIEHQMQVVAAQDRLIGLWTSFRADRLAIYHDLGVLPYQDWKSFYADLSAAPALAAPAIPAVQPEPRAADAPQPPSPPVAPRP